MTFRDYRVENVFPRLAGAIDGRDSPGLMPEDGRGFGRFESWPLVFWVSVVENRGRRRLAEPIGLHGVRSLR